MKAVLGEIIYPSSRICFLVEQKVLFGWWDLSIPPFSYYKDLQIRLHSKHFFIFVFGLINPNNTKNWDLSIPVTVRSFMQVKTYPKRRETNASNANGGGNNILETFQNAGSMFYGDASQSNIWTRAKHYYESIDMGGYFSPLSNPSTRPQYFFELTKKMAYFLSFFDLPRKDIKVEINTPKIVEPWIISEEIIDFRICTSLRRFNDDAGYHVERGWKWTSGYISHGCVNMKSDTFAIGDTMDIKVKQVLRDGEIEIDNRKY